MDIQEDIKQKKVPLSFNEKLIPEMDKHWRYLNFRSRTEYVNHLVRKDMEQNGQVQR